MHLKRYKVNDECIGCRACAELNVKNFRMNDKGKAYVIKQPETEEEAKLCEDAMELCPVFAIEAIEEKQDVEIEPVAEKQDDTFVEESLVAVSERDNMKKTLDRFPELKEYLPNISPKFKRLENPFIYNIICRFVNFEKAAKTVNIPVDNLIDRVNSYLSKRG